MEWVKADFIKLEASSRRPTLYTFTTETTIILESKTQSPPPKKFDLKL